MTYRTPSPPPSRAPHPASGPLTPSVAVIEHLPTGQTLITPARFLTPEGLREEFVRTGRIGRLSEEQSRRQSAQWTAYHARRGESGASQ